MLASAVKRPFSLNPRNQRVIRVIAASGALSALWWILSMQLATVDLAVFREVLKGFSDLTTTRIWQEVSPSALFSPAPSISYFVGLLLFSTAATWGGYKLSGAGRVIVAIQLIVFSFVYGWVCWQFLAVPGRPVGLVCGVLLGMCLGYIIKARDEERRILDARSVELKLRNHELLESRLAMVKQDEAERRLLAADLHDQILNDLRQVTQKFDKYSLKPDSQTAKTISTQLRQTMNDIREIMDDLCPVMLEEFGLCAAIEDRLDKASNHHGLDVRFNSSAEDAQLEQLTGVERQLIYRLVQESITNICKHANAKTVKVSVKSEDEHLVIQVLDDGKGIDPERFSQSSRGTLYMRLRAGLIGATVTWKSAPSGTGTLVEIRR